MHFQIFIPNASKGDNALAKVGLEHLLAGSQVHQHDLARGPGDVAGCLFTWQTKRGAVNVGYRPKDDWIPAVADGDLPAGRYWIGFDDAGLPTPEELERTYAMHGELIQLGDGQIWRLPNVDKLPADMIRADDGSTAFIPQRRYHQFTLEAMDWKRFFTDYEPGGRVLWESLRNFVERGLQANYRLIPEVSDRLRLWSSGESGTVEAAVDRAVDGALKMLRAASAEARNG